MARKNVLRYPLAQSQSLAAAFISPATYVKYLDNVSYQINLTTSDSTGAFAIQASNDYDIDETTGLGKNAGTWVTLPLGGGTGTPVAAGANDSILVDLNQLPFTAVRVIYTPTIAGTGTCDIWLVARTLGG